MKYSTLKKIDFLIFLLLILSLAILIGNLYDTWYHTKICIICACSIIVLLFLSCIIQNKISYYEFGLSELFWEYEAEVALDELSRNDLDKYMVLGLEKLKKQGQQYEMRINENRMKTKEKLMEKINQIEMD